MDGDSMDHGSDGGDLSSGQVGIELDWIGLDWLFGVGPLCCCCVDGRRKR